jgi:hypothetical protein
MTFYRRKLPHWFPNQAILFVSWRLAGSAPPRSPAILTLENTGRIWTPRKERDGLEAGPFWLQDPRIAGVVSGALRYGETVRRLYVLHAWVIMPNHIHVIFEPSVAVPGLMRWLKGRTSRLANRILGRTGRLEGRMAMDQRPYRGRRHYAIVLPYRPASFTIAAVNLIPSRRATASFSTSFFTARFSIGMSRGFSPRSTRAAIFPAAYPL